MNSIVQDEASRVNPRNNTFSDFEYDINKQIADWAYDNNNYAPSYDILVQNYWREVHGIEV